MLEARCPRCGMRRFGWALNSPCYQSCPNCGIGLEITEDGHKVMLGFSPFTADRLDEKKLQMDKKTESPEI
jgi:hypothetical protein